VVIQKSYHQVREQGLHDRRGVAQIRQKAFPLKKNTVNI
jgi:hypothetical protein